MATERELEELLSRPSAADAGLMGRLDGPLLLLGAGGKMGPTLAMRAKRAAEQAGVERRVIAVSRYSDAAAREKLEQCGVETISADLLNRDELAALPDSANVLYLAARKFGSSDSAYLTWGMNAWLPGIVAERYRHARIVAMSSGNIYPLVPVAGGGATEETPLAPVGEYGQSVLARERIFEYFSHLYGTRVVSVRLNYAVELRYGVLVDIGTAVFERKPIDLTMGNVNVIWQGDANSVILRSLELAATPPAVLNLTGPETISVRGIARQFARHFGVEPEFTGQPADTALLNNASRCHALFGNPTVTPGELIEWTAQWIGMGGASLGKATKFSVRDGKF
ncbi:MAG: NAD-dependent epimerase/dehydratase family protein [Candidatus Solibacter usitatus]|nr:NAD-dependent epimerase/dehydratase family protein [Candidatus Solibacter usitatus]